VTAGAVRSWIEGSRSLQAICEARSIAYLHVLQPTLHDTGSKTLTGDEIVGSRAPDAYIDGVHLGYPRLREAAGSLRNLGIHFLDASMIFKDVKEGIYVDNCHFNLAGNRLLARAIAPALADCLAAVKR
jgi:hypothetical protein